MSLSGNGTGDSTVPRESHLASNSCRPPPSADDARRRYGGRSGTLIGKPLPSRFSILFNFFAPTSNTRSHFLGQEAFYSSALRPRLDFPSPDSAVSGPDLVPPAVFGSSGGLSCSDYSVDAADGATTTIVCGPRPTREGGQQPDPAPPWPDLTCPTLCHARPIRWVADGPSRLRLRRWVCCPGFEEALTTRCAAVAKLHHMMATYGHMRRRCATFVALVSFLPRSGQLQGWELLAHVVVVLHRTCCRTQREHSIRAGQRGLVLYCSHKQETRLRHVAN